MMIQIYNILRLIVTAVFRDKQSKDGSMYSGGLLRQHHLGEVG